MELEFSDDELLLRTVWPRCIISDGSVRSAAFKPREGENGVSISEYGYTFTPNSSTNNGIVRSSIIIGKDENN